MPVYPCRWPTCNALVKTPGHCNAHQVNAAAAAAARQREYDQHRRDKEAKKFYDSAPWRRARSEKLATAPVCEFCGRAWAVEVHHEEALADAPARALDQSNLKSACKPCHSRIESRRPNSASTRTASPAGDKHVR